MAEGGAVVAVIGSATVAGVTVRSAAARRAAATSEVDGDEADKGACKGCARSEFETCAGGGCGGCCGIAEG